MVATIHRDEFDLFGPDSAPGSRVLDVFPSHVIVQQSLSKSDEDAAAFRSDLDGAWTSACADASCLIISADASVPNGCESSGRGCKWTVLYQLLGSRPQRKSNTLSFRLASQQPCHRVVVVWWSSQTWPWQLRLCWIQFIQFHAWGRFSPWKVVMWSTLGLPKTRCMHTLTLWHVPSHWEWGVHKKAHDAVASVWVGVGPHPHTSHNFLLVAVNISCNKKWHAQFSELSYHGIHSWTSRGPRGSPFFP
jgi:hypothetical protein